MKKAPAALLAVVVALVAADSAQALTKVVDAGPAGSAGGVFSQNSPAELNTFSLKTVTIHAGDKVKWVFTGFHTVTFPKKGGGDVPFAGPDPAGTKVSGVNDPANNPFWFNGQPRFVLNPLAALPQGGKTETGSKVTGSGLYQGNGTPPPYMLKFTKPGIYHYECVLHAGMEGVVKVVAKGKPIPSAATDRKVAKKALTAAATQAKALENYTPPAGTVTAGNDNGQIALLAFYPSTIHVPVGGTLTFTNTSKQEIHTFSFGPADYLNNLGNNFITPTPSPNGPPTLVLNPQLFYSSDRPPLTYSGSSAHGNGFFNTGVLEAGTPPLAASATIKFNQPGTYGFICLVHPFMHGTVVVG